MTQEEIIKLQNYLRGQFGTERINVMPRPKNDDSVEVTIGGEFIGVIYKDDEDPDDISYDFNMAILDIDL